MLVLLSGFQWVNLFWSRWSIWFLCSSKSHFWVRYDVRCSGGNCAGNPLILSFQESFESTKETCFIKSIILSVSGCSFCRESRYLWADAQRSLIEWIFTTSSQYPTVQSGTWSPVQPCRCSQINDCDCPISGHLRRFLRRSSDGVGRSTISSMLVMFGVRGDKKFWICGNGCFEIARLGSGKFCMS